MIIARITGLELAGDEIPGDERLADGARLFGTYLRRDGAPPKLIARGVVDGPEGILARQHAFIVGRGRGGCSVVVALAFQEPGLVADLAVAEFEPWKGEDAEPSGFLPLGRVVRFAADFVTGGMDEVAEAVALLETIFGTDPMVEPIEKAITHLQL